MTRVDIGPARRRMGVAAMPNADATATAETAPMHPARGRRVALFTLALGSLGALLASSHVPCGFAKIFGAPCPGCGSTRAMLALAHGDLAAYLRFHPLAPLMSLLLLVLVGQAYLSLLATGTFREVGQGRSGKVLVRLGLVVGVLEFALWLARFGGFLGGPVPV